MSFTQSDIDSSLDILNDSPEEKKCVKPAVKNRGSLFLTIMLKFNMIALKLGKLATAVYFLVEHCKLIHLLYLLEMGGEKNYVIVYYEENTFEKYNENSPKNHISSIEEMFDHCTFRMNPPQKLEIAYSSICRWNFQIVGFAEMKKEL
ncbi:hypothetical protein T11_405 [Trichinella zimbabwensis]|uniref:Uncharacterized protein n=1 Tax=Trichinella zimbabwensis TaxID=268475 RepID=A0A0V1I435_9BILA|nr:hypothetical protein T11_405 [Trichinella zimbabwensis]